MGASSSTANEFRSYLLNQDIMIQDDQFWQQLWTFPPKTDIREFLPTSFLVELNNTRPYNLAVCFQKVTDILARFNAEEFDDVLPDEV